MNFEAFVKDITDNKWNVFGTEVYKDNTLIHTWGDTIGLHEIYSATKSVLSVAVGIAYDEGMIDLNRSVVDYLPKDRTEMISDKQIDLFKKITIERLLTMSVSGFDFRAEGDDWLEYALNSRIEPEKREFNYSNISTYLAIGIARQCTRKIEIARKITLTVDFPCQISGQRIITPMRIDVNVDFTLLGRQGSVRIDYHAMSDTVEHSRECGLLDDILLALQ